MSKMPSDQQQNAEDDDLLAEYKLDYSKAKPNRFAANNDKPQKLTVVVLDDDVAQIFTTPAAVNKALRALIEAMPQSVSSEIS
jgi:hypothetical protein